MPKTSCLELDWRLRLQGLPHILKCDVEQAVLIQARAPGWKGRVLEGWWWCCRARSRRRADTPIGLVASITSTIGGSIAPGGRVAVHGTVGADDRQRRPRRCRVRACQAVRAAPRSRLRLVRPGEAC